MKTSLDPRHQRRREAVKALFTATYDRRVDNELAREVLSKKEKLDEMIAACAPQWPVEKLNRIDLSVLRLAVYELMVDKKEPVKVIIDEAIELAKEFGSESSPSFVNGVLGAVIDNKDEPTSPTDAS